MPQGHNRHDRKWHSLQGKRLGLSRQVDGGLLLDDERERDEERQRVVHPKHDSALPGGAVKGRRDLQSALILAEQARRRISGELDFRAVTSILDRFEFPESERFHFEVRDGKVVVFPAEMVEEPGPCHGPGCELDAEAGSDYCAYHELLEGQGDPYHRSGLSLIPLQDVGGVSRWDGYQNVDYTRSYRREIAWGRQHRARAAERDRVAGLRLERQKIRIEREAEAEAKRLVQRFHVETREPEWEWRQVQKQKTARSKLHQGRARRRTLERIRREMVTLDCSYDQAVEVVRHRFRFEGLRGVDPSLVRNLVSARPSKWGPTIERALGGETVLIPPGPTPSAKARKVRLALKASNRGGRFRWSVRVTQRGLRVRSLGPRTDLILV